MTDYTDLIARLRETVDSYLNGGGLIARPVNPDGPAAADAIEALVAERDAAQKALRTVQNAAKTLAAAHGSELRHLRENAAYDHRLRAEHESLIERDAQMTDALLRAERERDEAKRGADALWERYQALGREALALTEQRDEARALLREARDRWIPTHTWPEAVPALRDFYARIDGHLNGKTATDIDTERRVAAGLDPDGGFDGPTGAD
jgi:hypothetical protein